MNCPNCKAKNRPNAKFCAQCRAPLEPANMTMKVCPQCGKHNRLGAKFCAYCGYIFTAKVRRSAPPRVFYAGVAVVILLGLAIISLFLLRRGLSRAPGETVAATATPILTATSPSTAQIQLPVTSAPTTPTPVLPTRAFSEALDRALLATVQIIVPVDGQRLSSAGSGSVLTEKGHILTNFHVMGDPATGQLYNRSGRIDVAVSPADLKGPPQVRYIAELIQGNPSMDLALIKIVATQAGGDLPHDLGLTTMPIGDSDTVRIGDELSIIGFPGLGGETVTFTKGSVAGFLTDEGWIKTDAEINAGNSGGAAIDRAGQLVGIPSAATTESVRVPGKLGLVRPVNLARPLIELALRDAREGG